LLPVFEVFVFVAVYLGQREGLPVDVGTLPIEVFYLLQPHGSIVNEGAAEVVEYGEV
jgi:hypothetical protein